MNTIQRLVIEGTSTVRLVACGNCGQCFFPQIRNGIATDDSLAEAEQRAATCCAPRICRCGVTIDEQYYTACRGCRDLERSKAEAAQFEKATKIEASAAGPVYSHILDRYWASLEDYLDEVEDGEVARVPYLYDCTVVPFRVDASEALERAVERLKLDDDDYGRIVDEDELIQFGKAWNEKQTYTAWQPNTSRVVLVPPAATSSPAALA